MEALIDFAIVTALRVEREAIVRRLDSPQIISEPDVPYTYYRGRIGFPGVEGGYEIVVLQLLDVGNVDAAASAATLIHRWSPQFLLMLGIAGGVAQSGIEMGDVAVSRYVHYYEPGKRKEEGEERRPKKFSADRVLFGKANAYEASEWKDGVSVSPPGESNGFVPKAFFGPIASGELVISDSKTVTSLIAVAPKLIAVAMEGAGVAQAAENASIRFLEIRGISDMADPRKSDSWHEYAANAAAAFAVGFLKTKPVSTAAEARLRAEGARQVPVLAIRAQSQTLIRPDELLPVVQSRFRGRDIETTLIDLMPDK